MKTLRDRVTAGGNVRVDLPTIERSLTELWKLDGPEDGAVTRAALWNVVAHTPSSELHTRANEILGQAAAEVPQRTIVIRADESDEARLIAWISANCHMMGDGKQVCSEAVSIVAGGDRIHRVPPLVNALLIPDMPVAVWWIGDLPNEHEDYVEALLTPADRIIVDTIFFDRPDDLALLQRLAEKTVTAPADMNWMRLDEWRSATASIFDPPHMRDRLRSIRAVRVMTSVDNPNFFGQTIESLFYASWLTSQAGHDVDESGEVSCPHGAVEYNFKYERVPKLHGILQVEIEFRDGSFARISRDPERCILLANVDGVTSTPESVTRTRAKGSEDLIVRQLKRPEPDRIFLRVLPVSLRLARRMVG